MVNCSGSWNYTAHNCAIVVIDDHEPPPLLHLGIAKVAQQVLQLIMIVNNSI